MSKRPISYAGGRTPEQIWKEYLDEVRPGELAAAAVEAAMTQHDKGPEEA